MSNDKDTTRNWQAQFAPPPPPPLGSATAPLATDPDEVDADVEPAAPAGAPARLGASARRLSAVPAEMDRPSRAADRAKADEAGTPAPAAAAEPATRPAPTTGSAARSSRALATLLLAELADAGLAGQLAGVRRGPAGPSFDVDLGTEADVNELVLRADDLADALEVDQLRITRRGTAGGVTIDVLGSEADPAGERPKQSVVYLPLHVRAAAEEERHRTGETFTALVLGAFNRHYHRLGELFPHRVTTTGPMPLGKTAVRRRRGEETLVQAWVYLDSEQRTVLDDAVTTSGAGSRSNLISKLLELDLLGHDPA